MHILAFEQIEGQISLVTHFSGSLAFSAFLLNFGEAIHLAVCLILFPIFGKKFAVVDFGCNFVCTFAFVDCCFPNEMCFQFVTAGSKNEKRVYSHLCSMISRCKEKWFLLNQNFAQLLVLENCCNKMTCCPIDRITPPCIFPSFCMTVLDLTVRRGETFSPNVFCFGDWDKELC